MGKVRLFVDDLDPRDYAGAIRRGLAWIGIERRIRPGDRVLVKPNLTFPRYRKGVMASPMCVEALVEALKDYTDRIMVGEADSGGYNRFSMDEVFRETGLLDLTKKYGVNVVNLTGRPARDVEVVSGHRRLKIPLPAVVLDDTDCVVSLAVPKIHMNTRVSLSVKNLWGCIPLPPARLRLHPYLDDVLCAVVNALRKPVAVVDGRYGLNRSGPMRGEVVELNWLLMSDDCYTADATCCRLMGIAPASVSHLVDGTTRKPRSASETEVEMNRDLARMPVTRFYLRRSWTDYLSLLAFRYAVLSHLAYRSPLAAWLHRILYWFREPFYDYDHPFEPRSGSE
ncbi:MAG: DUF362 domain-containing protein [Verrucomicrobiota bacterium]|nr:DUF362 domain-containing protein [Verrucomicrobiota bacterium]